MTCSKPRFAFRKSPAARPAPKTYRPCLEMLEVRLQPSNSGFAVDGITAHPLPVSSSLGLSAHSIFADGVEPMLSLSTATYITGTMGTATARGTALGGDGSTFQAGTVTQNGSQEAYVAKYTPNGTQVYLTTIQLLDSNSNPLNTLGTGVAVDGLGDAYLGGTVIDGAGANHSYGVKLSPDGQTVVWVHSFQAGTTTQGIAVSDPNNDGTGIVAWTGTLTFTNPSQGPVGDHVILAEYAADGTGNLAFYYTFTGNPTTQGDAIALNTNSVFSTPGSLIYLAGNITLNGNEQTLAFQLDATTGNGNWARTDGADFASPASLTGVAVNADDSSVYSGTTSTSTGTNGIVVGYPANGGPVGQPPTFATTLSNALSLNAITVDAAGNIYATGAATDPSTGGVYVAKLDSSGNILSELQFGGTGTVDAGYGVVVTSSGSLWVVGDTTLASLATDGSTLNGTQDGFLAAVSV
ncbi:MAG TPA: hypothetical protein VKU02_14685 [Gemmataceae bacterium]|nr:hypothetical protein [Gemmataceae bacterium]